jgi:hypothetical protein
MSISRDCQIQGRCSPCRSFRLRERIILPSVTASEVRDIVQLAATPYLAAGIRRGIGQLGKPFVCEIVCCWRCTCSRQFRCFGLRPRYYVATDGLPLPRSMCVCFCYGTFSSARSLPFSQQFVVLSCAGSFVAEEACMFS